MVHTSLRQKARGNPWKDTKNKPKDDMGVPSNFSASLPAQFLCLSFTIFFLYLFPLTCRLLDRRRLEFQSVDLDGCWNSGLLWRFGPESRTKDSDGFLPLRRRTRRPTSKTPSSLPFALLLVIPSLTPSLSLSVFLSLFFPFFFSVLLSMFLSFRLFNSVTYTHTQLRTKHPGKLTPTQ